MPADADEARRVAEQILSGPEYQEPSTPWWQEVLEWIDELYQRVIGTLGGSGGGSVLGWIIVVVVGAAAIAVVVLAIRTLRRSPRRERSETEPESRRRRREPRVDWNEEAERLEAEGRWRDGMRARYRALVAVLSNRHVVDPAAARTTGEHRQEVGASAPVAADDFSSAAELFDRAWYGGRDTGPEEAARFGELARTVEGATGKGAKESATATATAERPASIEDGDR
ncbi:MAG TPA: DUF4129 domain-containing protein [Acidimicrobiales bacterium]